MAAKLFAVPHCVERFINGAQSWCEPCLRLEIAKFNGLWDTDYTFERFCSQCGFVNTVVVEDQAFCIGCKRKQDEAQRETAEAIAAHAAATSVGRLSHGDFCIETLACATLAKPRWIDVVEGAKMARRILKASWPTVKFKVQTSRYAGGCSTRVRWMDGPSARAVHAKIGHMKGSSFDGMIDLKSYHDSIHEGEAVHFSNDYMFTEWNTSEAQMKRALAACGEKYGAELVEGVDVKTWNWDGSAYLLFPAGSLYGYGERTVCTFTQQWLQDEAEREYGGWDQTEGETLDANEADGTNEANEAKGR